MCSSDLVRVDHFWPAIYKNAAPGVDVPDLLYDAYFGLRTDAGVTWLTDLPVDRLDYVPGTNLIEVEQHLGGRSLVTTLFSPWAWEAPAFALWVEVRSPAPGDRLVSLENLHVGRATPNGNVGAEETWPQAGGVVREAGDLYTVFHRPLVPPVGLAVPPENPYALATAGRAFPAPEAAVRQGTDDAVVGYEIGRAHV